MKRDIRQIDDGIPILPAVLIDLGSRILRHEFLNGEVADQIAIGFVDDHYGQGTIRASLNAIDGQLVLISSNGFDPDVFVSPFAPALIQVHAKGESPWLIGFGRSPKGGQIHPGLRPYFQC